MRVESLLVVVFQFLLQYLQFLLLYILFGYLLQINPVLLVKAFADLFFSV